MVKSQFRTFKFWLLLFSALFFIWMGISALINFYSGLNLMNLRVRSINEAISDCLGFWFCALVFIVPLYKFAMFIEVDKERRTITTKNLFTGYSKAYLFGEFIGYFRTLRRDPTGRDPHYSIIYLVRTNQKTLRLSSFYYSNMVDLAAAFKEIPYLGKVKYEVIKDLQFSFGKVSVS